MPALSGGDRREIAVLAACLATSALLFGLGTHVDTRWLVAAESGLLWPANRARDIVAAVATGRSENQRLKGELLRLRAEALRLRQSAGEAEGLRRALGFAAAQGPVLLAAQVTAEWGEPWPQFVRLSVGRGDGVQVGQPVVTAEGLVGRVALVEETSARVAVLTDPALAIACEVVPGGARGVLRFRAERRPGLYLSWVPLTDTVRVGEEVATSGLSALFPRGLPVGRVARVGRDPSGLVQEIEVRPFADVGRLREVFVVVDVERLVPWSAAPDSAVTPDSLGTGAPAADSAAVDPPASDALVPVTPAAPSGGAR